MFTKKSDSSFPPLPRPPTVGQMVEDIKSCENMHNDPTFLEGSRKSVFDEHTAVDIKFSTLKEFIEASQSLNILLKETGEKITTLQTSKLEVEETTDEIKEQGLKAIK